MAAAHIGEERFMRTRTMTSRIWMAATLAVLPVAGASTSHGAAISAKTEIKCFGALANAVSKRQAAVVKAMAACRNNLIASGTGSCPDQAANDAIQKSADAIARSLPKKCQSTCSVSGVSCIDDMFCPPNGNTPENCTAGAKQLPFHAANMGFPGPGCAGVLRPGVMANPIDFATCMAGMGKSNAETLIEMVYGSIDQSSGISAGAAKCLAAIARTLPKSAGKMVKAVSKCRNIQLGADPALIAADTCATDDAKTAESLAKELQKAGDSIGKFCTDDTIRELDICGAGPGGINSLADARICLGDVLAESAYSIDDAETRQYVRVSLINAAYAGTLRARCGDNVVNQIPNQFLLAGEECDGTDDSVCPGECAPPGDVFECTCKTNPRANYYTDGLFSELDNGWSGASHQSLFSNNHGFTTEVSGCDCDQFGAAGQEATCVGTSTNPICANYGRMGPRCSWDPYGTQTCDEHGNNNHVHADSDCAKCDQYSVNAGEYCTGEADCDSQCYDPNGTATGPCNKQSDCIAPDVCKGRCDSKTPYCNVLHDGAPLPMASQGSAVCSDTLFSTDIEGTRNIVTGEHALDMDMHSVTYLAQSTSRPCPVCGGFCSNPSVKAGEICEGTCSGPATQCRTGANAGLTCTGDGDCPGSRCLQVACRFDSDCSGNGTCEGANSPECSGGTCNLSLVCAGGSNNGRPCRIEAFTPFGTTSIDCPPPVASNISGSGLAVSYTPLTSEAVELEDPDTCDAPGYELLNGCHCVKNCTGGINYGAPCHSDADCPLDAIPTGYASCRGRGTTRAQPNRCAPSCTAAGANYGRGCGRNFTTCDGGAHDGAPCDEDADCAAGGGTCTANPTICDAGANTGQACNVAGDCPGGSCVDACPGGICTPFCVQKGQCVGGSNDGANCGVDLACPGGSCVVVDSEEGVCPSGPSLYHCSGKGFEYRVCTPGDAGTTNGCEAGLDNILGTDDDYVGAGTCIADVGNCFVDNAHAEGGDTLNGQGDPTNTKSVAVFCLQASSSDAVNATAGMPGPGRLRESGLVVPNFTRLP